MIDVSNRCEYPKVAQLYINKLNKTRNPTVEEVAALKDLSSLSGLKHADATFAPVIGAHTRTKQNSTEIENLYFAKRDTKKLAECCYEYLEDNKYNDRQRRMIHFFYAFHSFTPTPQDLENYSRLFRKAQDLDDIRGWATWNHDMLS